MPMRSHFRKSLRRRLLRIARPIICCCSNIRILLRSVLATADRLRNLGVDVFEADRGGRVTYHGIGQIVGYPVINLSPDREDVHRYVRDLEQVLIDTMADFGIDAFRVAGLTGVHTAEGKVAAIGVHIKRWVTTHGFALNVNTDLSYYNWIIACEGEPVASMERLLGREIELAEVEDRLDENFRTVFGYTYSPPHAHREAAIQRG
jgi:lipoyl(octanoyl) transferase